MLLVSDSLQHKSLELATELAEVGIDQLLSDGLLKEFPVLGTAVRLASLGLGVRDALFIRKVARFLRELALNGTHHEQPVQSGETFAMCTPEQAKRVGEAIALILDRMNDVDKPVILAQVFKAFARGKISFEQFRRLANSVDIAFVDDLRALARMNGGRTSDSSAYLESLQSSGLTALSQTGTPVTSAYGESSVYHPVILTDLGRLFIEATSEQPRE